MDPQVDLIIWFFLIFIIEIFASIGGEELIITFLKNLSKYKVASKMPYKARYVSCLPRYYDYYC